MKWLRALALLAALAPAPALANFTFTQGAGTTAFSFTGSGSCTGVQCFATAIINSSGTEIFTAANPAQVTGANGTFPVTGTITANQGGAWNIGTVTTLTGITNALPTGSNTIGKIDILGNAGAIMDFAGQNAGSPANALLIGGQFNTTPTTITSGSASPLQLDNAGRILSDIGAMGTTAINSGCVGALNGFSATIPATQCGVWGVYVINSLGPGPATPANSSPVTLGTPTPLKLSALSTTVTAIKGSAGQLYMLQCGNTNASEGYVQVFNVVAGSVVLGTTVPLLSVPIAATNTGGFALAAPMAFGTAMSAAATTTAGGSTALGTALDCNVAFN